MRSLEIDNGSGTLNQEATRWLNTFASCGSYGKAMHGVPTTSTSAKMVVFGVDGHLISCYRLL